MAKDVWTRRPDTPLESGGTWAVARLAHSLQSMFSIRTTYSDSICYRSDGAAPDRIALPFRLGIRISMRAPCHPGEGSLHLAHADGPPCATQLSPPRERIPYVDILHPDISHPNGRGGRFNCSGQTYSDPMVVPTQSNMHNCSVLLKLPNISN